MPLNRDKAAARLMEAGIFGFLGTQLLDALEECVDDPAMPVRNQPHQFAGTMLIPDYCLTCNVHVSTHP